MFKEGQKVVCVDATGQLNRRGVFQVEAGRVYRVRLCPGNTTYLEEDPTSYGWMSSRFKEYRQKTKNLPDWW